MNKQRLDEIVEHTLYMCNIVQQINEVVKLGNVEVISRSDAIKLINYTAKYRVIFTIEFIKRTDGTKRVMNGMTGVRRYVNGRGMPYNNIAKGLMTVYDLKAPGSGPDKYRQVPVDNITKLYVQKRLFKVVDDAEYNRISKPFATKANKDTNVEPVKGVSGNRGKKSVDQNPSTEPSKEKPKFNTSEPIKGIGYKGKPTSKAKGDSPETTDNTDIINQLRNISGEQDEEDFEDPDERPNR